MLLLETFLAGLVGTVLMSVTMTIIHRTEWANADMIRALGSFVTKDRESALGWGLAIHLVSGMLFAIPYAAILGAFGEAGPLMTVGLGAVLGFVHGLVMSLALLALAENHPVEQFQKADFEVAASHIAGHVAYGIGVAIVVAALHIQWGLNIAGS